MEPIELRINTSELTAALAAIGNATAIAPLMPVLAAELLSQTEANFRSGGQPAWPKLAERTIEQRTKMGAWPGPILQVTGDLARKVVSDAGPTFAAIGVAGANHPYAAAQQLGAMAGKNRSVKIPARPYLPIDANGNLTIYGQDGLLRVTHAWFQLRLG